MTLPIVRTVSDLRARVARWRQAQAAIGFVPTMGALHDGHLSLVRAALARTDRVIVSLFVNPKQFNNDGDFETYPRTEADDAAKLTALGADVLYAPTAREMYGPRFSTTVSVRHVSEGLCGAHRPGHFDGVATVVTKLLLQSGADFAFFGEKDFQQLQVVRRLVADLDIPVRIIGCPTVREKDGLALSSRNIHLSPAERATAPRLAETMFEAAERLTRGETPLTAIQAARASLHEAGFDTVEYVELRDEETLAPVETLERPARLLVAAWLGQTRLIDNVQVPQQQ